MAARTKKSNTDAAAPTDLTPVELDPPNPAIVRWETLAERPIDVFHDGDAEKILGDAHPRPAWADPDQDQTGRSHLSTAYASVPVRVVASHNFGVDDGDRWEPASAWISAKLYGNSHESISITFSQVKDLDGGRTRRWQNVAMSFQPHEARELIDVLQAALDLFGGDK